MKAKKKFGQNFLINDSVIKKISKSISPFENDLILEVGPGKGCLTKELKTHKTNLIGIEIDQDLKPYLSKLEDDLTQFLFEDILNINFEKFNYQNIYVVGNLPYYITTKIVTHITNNIERINEVVIMVQKEVGERFLANPGQKSYGFYTVYLNNFYEVSKIVDVSRKSFRPIPNVDSVVLKLSKKPYFLKDEKFVTFLKECFSFKRKTLKNNLKNINNEVLISFLVENNIKENVRSEELTLEQFKDLFAYLNKLNLV